MTRLLRRTSRVKPPLRGRAATDHHRGEFAPMASVRRPRRPYGVAGYPHRVTIKPTPPLSPVPPAPPHGPEAPSPRPPETSLYADLVQVYKSLGRLLRSLEQPWQWLLALAIALSSLLLLNRLL